VVLDEIKMEVSALESDAIVVEGQLEGQLKALNQQRVAPNIKNVVAREQMELFPDYTTADVLQRLPGVYIDRDQGEGRYVMVRGTEPRLTNVKVNGEELATNRVEERYSQLDIIGSNQVASIEVVKALTPDMDGDAIGGTVNLVTRSAFDYSGMRLRATVGGGYASLRGNPIYQGKLSYSNRFGADQNFGLTFTANWDHTDKGAHNSEKEWDTTEDINDNVIPWAMGDMDLRDYYNVRDRYGFGATFEYRPGDNSRFFIEGMWNKLNDDQQRGRKRLRFSRGDYQDPEGTVIADAEIRPIMETRVEELYQSQASAGGEHQLGNIQLDYRLSYSYGRELHPDQLSSEFRLRHIDFKLDFSDPKFPAYTVTNGVDINNPDLYNFNGMDYRTTTASNANIVGGFNLKVPFSLAGLASELKFGGKYRMKRKDRNDTRWGYDWEGDDFTMKDYVWDKQTPDFLDDHYNYGPQPDPDKMWDFFSRWRDNPDGLVGEKDIWDSKGQSYNAKEHIYAGYAMATVNWDRMMVLLGGRYEATSNEYTGTHLIFDDSGDLSSATDTTGDRDKSDFLPMVHFKYQLARMSNLRLAVTKTLARPNFFDLVPFLSVNPDDEEIRQGNPDLKTTTAWNIDAMFEHYFVGVGVASGGFFYKSLDNIIFELRGDIENPTSPYDGWEFRGPVNGGKATLTGFEVNWQQQFTFLPGMWAGIGIYANYTRIWAKSDLIEETREGVDALPGQSGNVGNLALSYEWGGLSLRASLMYQDKYLIEVSGDPTGEADQWRDEHLQLDLSGSYKIIPELDVFAEFVNVSNTPKVEYIGIPNRPIKQEYYSWWMRAGVRFSL
jgi:TonB-dependent receptor